MAPGDKDSRGRPWIGVLFTSCGVYARLYRQPRVLEHRGRCPRCLRELHVPVGEGGSPGGPPPGALTEEREPASSP